MTPEAVIWHELECGGYDKDLPLWRSLADAADGPVLDVGAGVGRVALELARRGHTVTALDADPELLAALQRSARAERLALQTVTADARSFELETTYALCIVAMQTIQLLGGAAGRRAFYGCAARHLAPGGRVAIAITDELEPFETDESGIGPLPDVCERDGIVYSSRATAVRERDGAFVLERRREVVTATGELTSELDQVTLDQVSPELIEREAGRAGLTPLRRELIEATDEYVSSVVVVLGG